MKLWPKNWGDFQHYKDRSPTWIKLHASILDDYDFCMMQVASRALAPMLWLLASRYEKGEINESPVKLAFKLRMTHEDFLNAVKPLLDNGFFEADSDMLAECLQSACLEERRERGEIEKEERDKTPLLPAIAAAPKVKKIASPEIIEKRRSTWKAYSDAFFLKYGTDPVRDAKTNSCVVKIVESLGNEAPDVAAFYLTHNGAWYVQKSHSIEYLAKDCSALRTQWATSNVITARKAHEGERIGARLAESLNDMDMDQPWGKQA